MPNFINNEGNLYSFIETRNKLDDTFSLRNRLRPWTKSSNETTLPNNFFSFYLPHFRQNLSAINLTANSRIRDVSFCSSSNISDDKIHEANNIGPKIIPTRNAFPKLPGEEEGGGGGE